MDNPRHPLASARQVSIRQLGAESFVAHNVQSPYRAKVLETFKRHKTPLNMDVELPTIEAIKRFVLKLKSRAASLCACRFVI